MPLALILLVNFLIIGIVFTGLWFWSRQTRDPSFVDAFWAFGMVILALTTFIMAGDGWLERKLVLAGLTIAWGLRLGLHLFHRWGREGPDRRYTALVGRLQEKRGWSYERTTGLAVFLPQAVLLFIVCLPVQLGQIGAVPAGFGILALFGFALAVFGIAYESIADWQLSVFKENPANKGKVMDQGLWAWSRHPNYFAEICTWWGIWLIAAETALGFWSFIGPAFLTFTLLRWSGVPLLEKGMKTSRPGYADYAARTSSVFPWPPKRKPADPGEPLDDGDDTTEYDSAV
jgi:steroid 5-alpha reductase family enzyme